MPLTIKLNHSTSETSQVRKVDPEHLSFIISDFSFSHFLKPAHERRVVVEEDQRATQSMAK